MLLTIFLLKILNILLSVNFYSWSLFTCFTAGHSADEKIFEKVLVKEVNGKNYPATLTYLK